MVITIQPVVGQESKFRNVYTGAGWIQGITRDGDRLLVVDRYNDRVILRDWRTGREKRFAATAFQALLSPDDKRIAIMRPGAALRVLYADGPETQAERPVLESKGARNIVGWAWSRDSSLLLAIIAGQADGRPSAAPRVFVVSAVTGESREVGSLDGGTAPWGVTFATDGHSILYNTSVRTGENANDIRVLGSPDPRHAWIAAGVLSGRKADSVSREPRGQHRGRGSERSVK